MRNARVLITQKCNRRCDGCCNKYARIMERMVAITSLDRFAGYDVVSLTGGEPLLNPAKTLRCIDMLNWLCVGKIYVYTAIWNPRFADVAVASDGIHYSIHAPATTRDVMMFNVAQADLSGGWSGWSHRLYVDDRVKQRLPIRSRVWSRVDISPWLSEDEVFLHNGPTGLPDGEELYLLTQDGDDETIGVAP